MSRLAFCCSVVFSLSVFAIGNAAEPEPPKPASKDSVIVQFKMFDANEPTLEFHPDLARKPIILLRNLATRQEEMFLGDKDSDAAIKESTTRKGFYEVTLPKGRLINQMFIDVVEANTNPGAIIKVVTANDIVVYPGASKSITPFPVTAYIAQLNQYASLLNQIAAEFPGRKDEVRKSLAARYGKLLRNMQAGLDKVEYRPEQQDQKEAAKRTLDDVLRLYGLLPPVPPQQRMAQCGCYFEPQRMFCCCLYEGRWWCWTTSHRWLYWDNSQWVAAGT
jgi:hypothetical protein